MNLFHNIYIYNIYVPDYASPENNLWYFRMTPTANFIMCTVAVVFAEQVIKLLAV